MMRMRNLLYLVFLLTQSTLTAQSVRYELPEEMLAGTPFTVTIHFDRDDLSGIARIRQAWPAGFVITEKESAGAIFSFSQQRLEFLWVALPSDKELTVRFQVTAGKEYAGEVTLPTVLYYLENNLLKEKALAPCKLDINGKGAKTIVQPELKPADPAQNKSNTAQTENNALRGHALAGNEKVTAQATTAAAAKQPVKAVKQEAVVSKSKDPKKAVIATAKTEQKTSEKKVEPKAVTATATAAKEQITFRIQVAALPQKGDKQELAAGFGLGANEIREEEHNGLYKYTVGDFASMNEARKKMKENVKMKGKAFITGYRNGVRIDLEEAIRLSKEK